MTHYIPQSSAEECRCGRLNTREHCPKCGVYSIRARSRKNNAILDDDRGRRELRTFTCLRCGHIFNNEDWKERCQAPRDTVTMALIRLREYRGKQEANRLRDMSSSTDKKQ